MSSHAHTPSHPRWMTRVLYAAAAYNLLWGSFVVCFPDLIFQWVSAETPRYPELWQCIGMIVGVYGVGYAAAARDPVRHWPIVLVGLLGKILGPLGFFDAVVLREVFPLAFGLTIVNNDLIWWVPFTLILHHAYRRHRPTSERISSSLPPSPFRPRESRRD